MHMYLYTYMHTPLLVVSLLIQAAYVSSEAPLQSVGYDVEPRPLVRETGPVIYLCSDQTFSTGRLVAFSAWFTQPGPGSTSVRFQVWRPVSSNLNGQDVFELMMEKIIAPIEGFYEETLSDDDRFIVYEGDRFGILNEGKGNLPIAASGHPGMLGSSYFHQLSDHETVPSVGDVHLFSSVPFDYQFSVSAIYQPLRGIAEVVGNGRNRSFRPSGTLEDNPASNNAPQQNMVDDVQSIGDDVQSIGDDVQSIGDDVQSIGDDVQSIGDDVQSIGDNVQNRGDDAQSVGYDVQSVGYDVEPRPLVRETGPVIYLCSDQTFSTGRLVAFSAWFTQPGPGSTSVRFQVWRPLAGSDGKFVLMMEKTVQPVEGFHLEDVSDGEEFIVREGDKFGILNEGKGNLPIAASLHEGVPGESYFHHLGDHQMLPSAGDIVNFISMPYRYRFSISALYEPRADDIGNDGESIVELDPIVLNFNNVESASRTLNRSRSTRLTDLLGEIGYAVETTGDDGAAGNPGTISPQRHGEEPDIFDSWLVATGPSDPDIETPLLWGEGVMGSTGATGHTGPAGPPGQRGERGPQGATGELGPRGGRGKTGSTGATGPSGDRGEKGETGDRGMKGYDGHTGPSGPTGVAGHTGHTGPEGRQGERGRTGAAGATGGVGLPGQPYIDINECGGVDHGCDHGCEDKLGHYVCVCRHGYRLAENGRSCKDIDECTHDNGGCEDVCVNIVGSYHCSCGLGGLKPGPDRHSCQDIRECDVDNGGCLEGDTCVDVHGAHYCLRLGVSVASHEPLAVLWSGSASPEYAIMVENKLVNYRVVLGIIIWLSVLSLVSLIMITCYCVINVREERKKTDFSRSIRRALRSLRKRY